MCGALAQKIGIYALLGFFVAGIMAGSAKALTEKTRHVISQMVHAIFVPLFFASIGLQIDVFKNFNIALVLFVVCMSFGGKFLGAWIGANLAKTPKSNCLPIAIAHTAGGVMEVVIGLLALQYNLITESLFVALIFAAIVSSILLGPWLSYAIKRRKEISVLEFFSFRAITFELNAIERDAAIWELCDLAAEQESNFDMQEIYKKALERENAMGTAIEEGIAVPHARISWLKKPFVLFGRSTHGIEWNAPDGKLTHFIFLILTPEHGDDIQVQILSSIARAMNSSHTRHAILTAKDQDILWSLLNNVLTPQVIARK
jgi:mannitol/fructose-specific phosphotransferase system IIA component (Ntr-type)